MFITADLVIFIEYAVQQHAINNDRHYAKHSESRRPCDLKGGRNWRAGNPANKRVQPSLMWKIYSMHSLRDKIVR